MITFTKIRWKNFLSTGDKFTEIDLNETSTTLIVGANGAGKSTFVDALSFALFGRPHRNINKPQLVNSVNSKDMICEVEFKTPRAAYRIVRGIKPNIFEIYENSILVNQDSTTRDYQKYLEQNIIKLNHKTFHQVVVLGSSSFVPFMQLPAAQRRSVIEDLLDISVFSKMTTIMKEEVAKLKASATDTKHRIELTESKIQLKEEHLEELKSISRSLLEEKKTELQNLTLESVELMKELDTLNKEYKKQYEAHIGEIDELTRQKDNFRNILGGYETRLKEIDGRIKFFDKNHACPTCEQGITENIRQSRLDELNAQQIQLQSDIDNTTSSYGGVLKLIDGTRDDREHINTLNTRSSILSGKVSANAARAKNLKGQIRDIESKIGSTETDGDNLAVYRTELEDLQIGLSKVKGDMNYYSVISEMLKDSGIKTKIVKQYLPVMNRLVNRYLSTLDFFVHFSLDENFNEVIKSRHLDKFSYASFSEGEKQRIDLALLFTWRHVAKMKNSVVTNLLLLDETFDSSLDGEGIECLMKILDTLDKSTNTFVISHKGDVLETQFDKTIRFHKEGNFSKAEYS